MSRTKAAIDAIASYLGLGNGVVWHQMQVENMYDLEFAKKALDQEEKQKEQDNARDS